MACLRLGPALDLIENSVHGKRRDPDQAEGTYIYKTLARAADERILAKGQDGGAVTALLAWGLDTGELDGAVLAAPSETVPWLDEPKVVQSSEELLQTAGSRYTYCSARLGSKKAVAAKCKNVALVGVSCESTAVRQMAAEGIKRWTRPVKLVIGLMCCETFDYESFMVGKVQQERQIPLTDITKVNVKGKVIVSLKDGTDVDIPLKDARPYANEWCHHCPDFAAEHADISCGGLGMEGWTMVLVRSETGRDYLERAVAAGVIQLRGAEEEPGALEVMDRLARKQRARIHPFDPHASAAWPTEQLLQAARAEAAEGSGR